LDSIDVILHRPQSSENVGAVARAMKNFGLRRLVLVAPPRYEHDRSRILAVHAEDILENAIIVSTIEDALAPYLLVIPTTERSVEARPAPLTPRQAADSLVSRASSGRVAVLFGEESHGLDDAFLARFPFYSSIPADPRRKSLNLAQAVLLYAWELFQRSGEAPELVRPDHPGPRDEAAPLQLVNILRDRSRSLLLDAGFLNPQNPEAIMDELLRLLQRGQPTRREMELLLAALAQLRRTSAVSRT